MSSWIFRALCRPIFPQFRPSFPRKREAQKSGNPQESSESWPTAQISMNLGFVEWKQPHLRRHHTVGFGLMKHDLQNSNHYCSFHWPWKPQSTFEFPGSCSWDQNPCVAVLRALKWPHTLHVWAGTCDPFDGQPLDEIWKLNTHFDALNSAVLSQPS